MGTIVPQVNKKEPIFQSRDNVRKEQTFLYKKKRNVINWEQSSSCQHKGIATLKGNALIGTIVPQAIKKDRNDKRGTMPLGTFRNKKFLSMLKIRNKRFFLALNEHFVPIFHNNLFLFMLKGPLQRGTIIP